MAMGPGHSRSLRTSPQVETQPPVEVLKPATLSSPLARAAYRFPAAIYSKDRLN